MEHRAPLIKFILKSFLIDLEESIKPLIDINDRIYFAETIKAYLEGIYRSVPENEYFEAVYFDEEEFIRTKLLSKFRDKMVPFVKSSLKHYFAKDEFNKTQLFQKLKITEPILDYEEYETYINYLHHYLGKWLDGLYLLPINTPHSTTNELPKLPEQPEQNTKKSEYNRSRQLLLFYYFAKSAGLVRQGTSLRALAQFAHYLFNYPNDNIDNSEVYKQLKKAPYIKEDSYLLKDLELVKQQFELIEHTEALALVQKEIHDVKKSTNKK